MAQDTFATLWNRVLLYAPDTPVFLAKRLVQNAHRRILDHHYWSEMKKSDEITIAAPYVTGTIEWTQGGTTITGTGTAWAAAHLYQQIHINSQGNFFTITAVNSPTEIEVDRAIPYVSDSEVSYTIAQRYLELPQDLEVLEVVRDQANEWRIDTQYFNQEYLDRIDPNRTSTGTVNIFVYATNRIDSNGNQIPRMELWPSPGAEFTINFRYRATSSLSSATDRGLEIVPSDAYIWGALMELALWPGTKDVENRYFSVETYKLHRDEFTEALRDAVVADFDRDQRMITYGMGENRSVPIDAKYLQSHGF